MECVTGIRWQSEYLLYKGKTQYVQIWNILDTPIKHPILGQSSPMIKVHMDVIFDMIKQKMYTAFSYWRVLIIC